MAYAAGMANGTDRADGMAERASVCYTSEVMALYS
jgi:hypothetical protein